MDEADLEPETELTERGLDQGLRCSRYHLTRQDKDSKVVYRIDIYNRPPLFMLIRVSIFTHA